MDTLPDPKPMPSTSLLRLWASDPANVHCWGLDAVADEMDRLRGIANEVMYEHRLEWGPESRQPISNHGGES